MNNLKLIGLDKRSLGAFRIVVGLNLIYNIIKYRFGFVDAFYVDNSIVSQVLIRYKYGDSWSLINYFGDSALAINIFLWIFLLVAVLYTIGFHSKITGILSYVFLWSVIHRNPYLVHSVEFLIEVSLLWGLFLPLNERLSFFPSKNTDDKVEVMNYGVIAIMLQIFFIYCSGTISKTGTLWQEGLAVEAVMGDRTHAGLIAPFLSSSPFLCKILSYATLYIEMVIAILIFSPWKTKLLRAFVGFSLIGLHWSLGLAMNVGTFYFSTFAFAVLVMPSMVWDRLGVPADHNFKQLRAGYFNYSDGVQKTIRYSSFVIISFLLLFIAQKNIYNWSKSSYVKDNPIVKGIAKIPTPVIGVSGTFRQHWFFFAPDPYPEMGTIMFIGTNDRGESFDLLTGKKAFQVNAVTNQINVINEPYNHFSGSRFVFSWYIRRSYMEVPKELLRKWLSYEYKRYKKRNPTTHWPEISLLLYSNYTEYKKLRLKRTTGIQVLDSYRPSNN
ncbi:MAG: hypothetical protein IH946_04935 [Bacteroidetes bacterium]|nr:hypothetical protein [Bacteroidota bacterium]